MDQLPFGPGVNLTPELAASLDRHLELSKVLTSQGPNFGTPAAKADRRKREPVYITSDVLCLPRFRDMRISLRDFRLFLVLKFVFGNGIWLSPIQWDLASHSLTSIVVPKSFLDRSIPPTEHQRAAEESLLIATVLAFCLKYTSPDEIPDNELCQDVLAYLITVLGKPLTYFRGKYFSLSGTITQVLTRVAYSHGRWSHPRRKRPVRSPSAVSAGNSRNRNPWKSTPQRLLAKEPQGGQVRLDPLYLLRTIEDSIHDMYLHRLNAGSFF